MGLAMLFGWALTAAAAMAASLVSVLALRALARRTNVAPGRSTILVAGTLLASALVESLFIWLDVRIASSHAQGLPRVLALAAVSTGLLVALLRPVRSDPGRRAAHSLYWVVVAAAALVPIVSWAALVVVPARAAADRAAVRSAYDEAQAMNDHQRAEALLDEHPWLRDELQHALDGTVPLDE